MAGSAGQCGVMDSPAEGSQHGAVCLAEVRGHQHASVTAQPDRLRTDDPDSQAKCGAGLYIEGNVWALDNAKNGHQRFVPANRPLRRYIGYEDGRPMCHENNGTAKKRNAADSVLRHMIITISSSQTT